MDRPSAFSISLWFYRRSDISGDDNDTNHQVNNVLVAQSSNFDNDNLEIGTEGVLLKFIWIPEVMTPPLSRGIWVLLTIAGIILFSPMEIPVYWHIWMVVWR